MKEERIRTGGSVTSPDVPAMWTVPSVLALLVVVAVAAAARLYRVGWQPLWLDEGWSEWASRQTLDYLWRVWPAVDPHPPLYYTLLKGWHALAGNSEAAMRLPSVLFGVATVPLVFAMGRMLDVGRSGVVCGSLAAAMFALSPVHLQYAQEARPYSMLTWAVALAMVCAMWLMVNPGRACATRQQLAAVAGGAWLPYVLICLATGLAWITWAHYTGGAAVVAVAVALLYWWTTDARRCRQAARRLLMTGAFALLLCLPNLWLLVDNLTTAVAGVEWLKAPSLSGIQRVTIRIVGTTGGEGFYAFVIVWTLAVLGVVFLWRDGRRAIVSLLAAVALLPPVAELTVSALGRPVFLERTLIYINLPLFVAAGYALSRIRTLPVQVMVALTVLAPLTLGGVSYFRDFHKEPWHRVAEELASFLPPGGVTLLLPAHNAVALDYYAQRTNATFKSIGIPADWPQPALGRPASDALPVRKRLDAGDMIRVREYAARSERLALVVRNPAVQDPESLVIREIQKTHALESSWQDGTVTVMKFSLRRVE